MKKFFLPLLVFFSLLPAVNAQKAQKAVYGVAFYNLENLFDTINNNGKYDIEFSPQGSRQWDGKKYWQKQYNMAYAISQMANKFIPDGPAIVGICEIENVDVIKDLVNMAPIKHNKYKIVHYDSPDKRGVDVGMIYNPKFFKVLHSNSHRLTLEDRPSFKTRDQLVVTGLLGGVKISVIVNHWPSRLGGERASSFLREAAAALTKHIADSLFAEDPNAGVIIMGDLNDDPDNKSVKDVIGAKKKISEVPVNGFYNPFWSLLDKGIGSLAYDGKWNLFDQILVSQNLLDGQSKLKYWRAEVFNFAFLTNRSGDYKGYPFRTFAGGVFLNGYSDHFPTIVYLTKGIDGNTIQSEE